MNDDLNDLYQEVILEHAKSPRNFRELPGANRIAHGRNPLCGDNYTVYLLMEGDVVKEATFQGSGCAISKASASLLTSTIKGKTRADVEALFGKVHAMVTTGHADDSLGKLAAFAGVHKFPARVKCASLSWHAAKAAVEGSAETVSTEGDNPKAE
ncbi:MAG: SUF system NifU family Fe-S cluster assembly protein [Verrucomicrobia bacterium]|nr:SUF system NifU family Fe-S cluster assembly protein [Verrucomicrobiota bacterium]